MTLEHPAFLFVVGFALLAELFFIVRVIRVVRRSPDEFVALRTKLVTEVRRSRPTYKDDGTDGTMARIRIGLLLTNTAMKQALTPKVSAQRLSVLLDAWAAILPPRIVNEDLGDYLEDIHRRCAAGQRWCVYLRVAAAIFWTGLNAVGYAMKAVGKRRAR